ncbi:MAG: VOC family protein [Solirubrobacteraceae bacterium]
MPSAVYVEINVPDAPEALTFYRNVFAWENFAVEGTQIPYHIAGTVDGPAAAAIIPSALAPFALPYFHTNDLDGTLAKIGAQSGQAIFARPIEGLGRIGHFKDPDGNAFGLLQTEKHAPLGRISPDLVAASAKGAAAPAESRATYFVEIAVTDVGRAREFYASVFGWTTKEADGPIEYHLAGEADGPVVAGLFPNAAAPHTLVYFRTDNLGATLDRIRQHGGHVILEQRVRGLGAVAQWKDPHGNAFGLTYESPKAPLARL